MPDAPYGSNRSAGRPRRGRGRREPRPLGELVSGVLDDLAVESNQVLRAILRQWPDVVGVATAQHCEPAALRDGVLEIDTDSSLWCQELTLRSRAILSALRRTHGREAPRSLWCRVR